jgi:hypothetical protein
MSWLQETFGKHEIQSPAQISLTRQWTREVADAKAGAAWFMSWSPACRVRWAASLLWVAREDALDVPGDLLAWIDNLALEYHE